MAPNPRSKASIRKSVKARSGKASGKAKKSSGHPGGDLWEVEKLLDERVVDGERSFLVQWAGHDPATGTQWLPQWEPEGNVGGDHITTWNEAAAVAKLREERAVFGGSGGLDVAVQHVEMGESSTLEDSACLDTGADAHTTGIPPALASWPVVDLVETARLAMAASVESLVASGQTDILVSSGVVSKSHSNVSRKIPVENRKRGTPPSPQTLSLPSAKKVCTARTIRQDPGTGVAPDLSKSPQTQQHTTRTPANMAPITEILERNFAPGAFKAKFDARRAERQAERAAAADTAVVSGNLIEAPAPSTNDLDQRDHDAPDSEEDEDESILYDEPPLQAGEHLVPLLSDHPYLLPRYNDVFTARKGLTYDFKGHATDPNAIKGMEKVLAELRDLLANVELVFFDACSSIEEVLQDTTPAMLALNFEDKNPKFRFLKSFIDVCRERRLHVVIYARPGLLTDLIETYLQGKKVQCSRPDVQPAAKQYEHEGELSFSVISTSPESSRAIVRAADLILCFDNSYDMASKQMREVRASARDAAAPVVALIPVNSLEHVERLVRSDAKYSVSERLDALFEFSWRLRSDFEDVKSMRAENEMYDPESAGAALGNAFLIASAAPGASPNLSACNFPSLSGIRDRVADSSDSESDSGSPSGDSSAAQAPLTSKRQLDSDEDSEQKRLRVHAPERPMDTEATSNDITATTLQVTEDVGMPDAVVTSTTEPLVPTAPAQTVSLVRYEAHERQYKQLESDMEGLMERYDNRGSEIREMQARLKVYEEVAARQKKLDDRRAENDKAKDDLIITLKKELSEAKEDLVKSDKFLRVKVIEVGNEKDKLATELTKVQKTLKSVQDTQGYIQDQYQKARDAVIVANQTSDELEKEKEELTTKLTVLQQDARGKSADVRVDTYLNEMRALQQQVKSLTGLVRRKEEEIKMLKNGRSGVATRNASVPRTPAVTGAQNAGSRSNSPMTGTGAGTGNSRVNVLRRNS